MFDFVFLGSSYYFNYAFNFIIIIPGQEKKINKSDSFSSCSEITIHHN